MLSDNAEKYVRKNHRKKYAEQVLFSISTHRLQSGRDCKGPLVILIMYNPKNTYRSSWSSVGLKLLQNMIACPACPCLTVFYTFPCLIIWWGGKYLTSIYSNLFCFHLQTHVEADWLFKDVIHRQVPGLFRRSFFLCFFLQNVTFCRMYLSFSSVWWVNWLLIASLHLYHKQQLNVFLIFHFLSLRTRTGLRQGLTFTYKDILACFYWTLHLEPEITLWFCYCLQK